MGVDEVGVATDCVTTWRNAAAAVAHAAGRVDPGLWALRSATAAARHCEAGGGLVAGFAAALRDIVPYPVRPAAPGPGRLTHTVLTLATGIYDGKAFDRLPILADALEEAGCRDTDLLNHCRGDGPHVRGCWVIDALLGKN